MFTSYLAHGYYLYFFCGVRRIINELYALLFSIDTAFSIVGSIKMVFSFLQKGPMTFKSIPLLLHNLQLHSQLWYPLSTGYKRRLRPDILVI